MEDKFGSLSSFQGEELDFRVHIQHEGDEKYVVLKVHAEKPFISIVSAPLPYHYMIVENYSNVLKENEKITKILGGGLLKIKKRERTIHTYGQSGSYGKADTGLVKAVLSSAFPGWHLDITSTDYVRG